MELSKKLEIFIRTYNRCELMKTTLQSVLNQSAKNIKVTVFDNASTDGTGDYVRSLMQEHGNLFYFRTQENIIFEKRLDIVLPLISAEYVIFFHDDDIMHPQYAECVIKALEDHPEAELVTSWMWPFRKEEEVVFDDYSTCSYRLYREKLDFVSYVYASWILYWDKNVFFPGVVYKGTTSSVCSPASMSWEKSPTSPSFWTLSKRET
ncbi:MAG: glycosyltransferase family 2 protein [Treponema sp.]|nr:glycosyltransferase family 2 protein [Treponema sp.]